MILVISNSHFDISVASFLTFSQLTFVTREIICCAPARKRFLQDKCLSSLGNCAADKASPEEGSPISFGSSYRLDFPGGEVIVPATHPYISLVIFIDAWDVCTDSEIQPLYVYPNNKEI